MKYVLCLVAMLFTSVGVAVAADEAKDEQQTEVGATFESASQDWAASGLKGVYFGVSNFDRGIGSFAFRTATSPGRGTYFYLNAYRQPDNMTFHASGSLSYNGVDYPGAIYVDGTGANRRNFFFSTRAEANGRYRMFVCEGAIVPGCFLPYQYCTRRNL